MSDLTAYTPRDLDRPDLLDPVTDGWIASIAEVAQLAAYVCETAFVPAPLRGNAPAVAATILYGREIGIPPITALQTMHVINGRVGMAAELMRARVLAAGHEIEVVESTAALCRMRGRRRGGERWAEVQWSKGDAQQAGLRGDGWTKYPRAMLVARASAELCRLVFPDVTHGMSATEEIVDDTTTPAPEPAANSRKVARAARVQPSITPSSSEGPAPSSAAAPEPPREESAQRRGAAPPPEVPEPPREVSRSPRAAAPPEVPEPERMRGEEPLPFVGTETYPPLAVVEERGEDHPAPETAEQWKARVGSGLTPEEEALTESALSRPEVDEAAWNHNTVEAVIEADPLVGDEADPRAQGRLTGDGPATRAQQRHVMALLRRLGIGATREERLHVGQGLVGRPVSTFSDLTVSDAGRMITTLLIALDSDDPPAMVRWLVDEEHRRQAETETGMGDE